jgi:hypothetical protein
VDSVPELVGVPEEAKKAFPVPRRTGSYYEGFAAWIDLRRGEQLSEIVSDELAALHAALLEAGVR